MKNIILDKKGIVDIDALVKLKGQEILQEKLREILMLKIEAKLCDKYKEENK
jgi:hypothetical protein